MGKVCKSTIRLLPPVKMSAKHRKAYLRALKSNNPNIRPIRIGSRPAGSSSRCSKSIIYNTANIDLDRSGIAEVILINHRTDFTGQGCKRFLPTLSVTIHDVCSNGQRSKALKQALPLKPYIVPTPRSPRFDLYAVDVNGDKIRDIVTIDKYTGGMYVFLVK